MVMNNMEVYKNEMQKEANYCALSVCKNSCASNIIGVMGNDIHRKQIIIQLFQYSRGIPMLQEHAPL